MKKGLFLFVVVLLSVGMSAQSDSLNLLGTCTVNDLKQQPYTGWFVENYSAYVPNRKVVKQLKEQDLSQLSVDVFFGTWCSDSQREVPRFLKVLDSIGVSPQACRLVGIGNAEPLYRQSPNNEEKGKHVYRAPTFIIFLDNIEIGRIIEYPATSLERDLLDIITDSQYIPNYPSYLILGAWLDEGILEDINVSYKGLANQIRHITSSANELNSFANLLSRREKANPKIISTVLRINCNLYPEVYWTYTKLAEALSNNEGKHEEASEILQEGIEHIKAEADQTRMQELLETVLSKIE
ncbi:hypothetical protein FACS1894181_00320 [Bacteroidia bacterium]|nr:hypothetical protein FACS1894181_00320 [Bacteroidia bacterium]